MSRRADATAERTAQIADALDRERDPINGKSAGDAGKRRENAAALKKAEHRCKRLSRDLVQVWNRITRVRHDLARHHNDEARQVYLNTRLLDLCAEQDRLERRMTKAADDLTRIRIAAGQPTTPRPRERHALQPSLLLGAL
jgi:hypothetical protein